MAEETAQRVLPTVTGVRRGASDRGVTKARHRNRPAAAPSWVVGTRLAATDGDPLHHRISAVRQAEFLNYAAEARNDSAFGFHLAEHTDPRDAGILFYVASGAQNLNEALTLFARYFRIVNEAVRLNMTRSPQGLAVEIIFVGLPRHSLRQNAEFGISVLLKALRLIADRNVRPSWAAFAHARNSNLQEFGRFYGCPVEFGASSDLLQFSNESLAIPLTGDAKLLKALRPFVEMAAKERHTEPGTVRAAVANEVEKLLPHGKANKHSVAKTLALSVRTLSRRLADEGTTYEEVVDQLRRSLALQYVKEPSLSFSQIAWLLGYEGSTSFNHAFSRWTGQSPSAARNQKILPGPLA